MKVLWIKGRSRLSFSRPFVAMVLGSRGTGKSTLIETFGCYFLRKNHKVLDIFGSRDGENLAWLRSPYVKDRKVLLIRGDNTDVDCSWPVKAVSNVTLQDIENHDITISSSPLYSDPDVEFQAVAKLTDLVYQRLSWKKIIYMIVREASNLYYSRLKVTRNQQLAKSQEIYLLRESRHMGISVGLDTLKFTSVDVDVRAVCDYQIFKALGLIGLPRELKWIFGFIDPRVVRTLKPNQFILLSRTSALGLGVFKPLPWHKQERENILRQLDIKVEHGEQIKEAKDRGVYHTVGDREHAEIIMAYAGGRSMVQIAKEKERSSGTIKLHVHKHDDAVERSGFCPACRRVKCEYASVKVRRTALTHF